MNIAVTFLPRQEPTPLPPIAFIGGGNMASAIIAGLIRQDTPAATFEVVEPFAEARERLARDFGIVAAGRGRRGTGALRGRGLGGQAAELRRGRRAGARAGARRPAPERRRRHPVRQHRALARHRAGGARHAQHAGAGRPGHDRAVRARSASTRRAGSAVEQVLGATGELLWVDAEERARRGHRDLRLRARPTCSISSRR